MQCRGADAVDGVGKVASLPAHDDPGLESRLIVDDVRGRRIQPPGVVAGFLRGYQGVSRT